MIARTLAFALGVFGAFGASQLPEFAQQYRQRLGGALDELTAIVQRFDQDAARLNLDREQGIARLRAAPDAFSRQRAEAEADTLRRYEKLKLHREVMANSGPFLRMTTVFTEGDRELVDRTLTDFEPALPATTEGAALAAGGFAGFYALIRLLAAPFRRRNPAPRRA
jgi:Protein of unknown function (DUF2937)